MSMDLTAQIDAYCERVDPSFWAEPWNAVTNAAFLIAALVMAWRLRGSGLAIGWALVGTLALIGLSSWAWHTWAYAWTGAADSLSILVFILIYFWASNRYFWGLSPLWSTIWMLGFFPYAAGLGWVISKIPFFEISGIYWAVALLIAGHGVAFLRRLPEVGRGLLIGAGILTLSITARSLDELLCHTLPLGTHFLWHVFNAIMLGWMIEVYRRHRMAR